MAIVVAVLAFGLHKYSAWWDRVQHLRFLSTRQFALGALGERTHAYATRNDGRLPQSMEEFIDAGLLGKSEVAFLDQRSGVKITRTLRAVPTTQASEELILFIEAYDPSADEWSVLDLSGFSYICKDLAGRIASDNALRREQGLPEIR